MKKFSVFMVIGILLLTGCATLFTGTSDSIYFKSKPDGAEIYIDGLKFGKTPANVTVKRSLSEKQVVLKLEGYEDRIFTLQRDFNVIAILNMAGLIGWAIDAATGSIYKYNPKVYDLDLTPENSSFNINELKRDDLGRYIVPSISDEIGVYDNTTGLKLIFSK